MAVCKGGVQPIGSLTQPDSNYAYRPVDITSLHHLEKSLFGIQYAGNVLTPNEF